MKSHQKTKKASRKSLFLVAERGHGALKAPHFAALGPMQAVVLRLLQEVWRVPLQPLH